MDAHNLPFNYHLADWQIIDPGASGSIDVSRSGTCLLVSTGAESRTLPRPTRLGQWSIVVLQTDGGDVTLTVTGGYNTAGSTTITLNDAGDQVRFDAIKSGSDFLWRSIGVSGISSDFGTDGIKADVVAESTSAAGVTVDGTLVKDGGITTATSSASVIGTSATLAVTTADKLTIGGVIAPQVLELAFAIQPNATVTEYDLWVAPAAYQVTSIKYVPSTLQGGAMTATVVKAVSTATPVKTTTPMVTADVIDLNANAYTVVTPSLTVTTADLVLAAGNRIGLDFSAAPTAAFWALSITLKRV